MKSADVVVTGEGRLDEQSAHLKGPYALARLSRMQGKRVVIFAGSVGAATGGARASFDEVVPVTPPGTAPGEVKARAASLLETAAATWAKGVRAPPKQE